MVLNRFNFKESAFRKKLAELPTSLTLGPGGEAIGPGIEPPKKIPTVFDTLLEAREKVGKFLSPKEIVEYEEKTGKKFKPFQTTQDPLYKKAMSAYIRESGMGFVSGGMKIVGGGGQAAKKIIPKVIQGVEKELKPLTQEAGKVIPKELVNELPIYKTSIERELKNSGFSEPFEIKLAGSRAKGTAKATSDMDIFVVTTDKGMDFLRSPQATDLNIRLDKLKYQLAKKATYPLEVLYLSKSDIRPTEKLIDIVTQEATAVAGQAGKVVARDVQDTTKDFVYKGLKDFVENPRKSTADVYARLATEAQETVKKIEKGTASMVEINKGQELLKLAEPSDAVKKMTQALKEAKPIRGQQEAIYTAERGAKMAKALAVGEKTAGESGFYAELGQLKGEMPKVQFESLRGKIGQGDIDTLFDQVKNSPLLGFFDKVSTRGALGKMLEGRVPTEREISLLSRVFPKEFVETVLGKRDLFTKIKEAGYQLANIPRSVMASVDLSAPFRQGLFLISHPKRFFGAFADMFKSFGSEKSFKAVQESIVRKPSFDLMQEAKLALTDMDAVLTTREERFMSGWAEKIPVAGKVIRASGRAYSGFLNKLRADVFDDLITKADKLGLMPRSNPKLVNEIANFVNIASGRGSLGKLQGAATALNSFFFSPRLMASRLTILNPLYYIKADPFVRKEALKSLFTVAGVASSILGLAKLAGADVVTDPRNADFAKLKIGNTRVDILGGTQQYIRMAAQLISGKYISSTTGKEITLGEGYKPLTRLDILERQIEAKEAPVFSFLTDLLKGQDFEGKKINIPKEIGARFIPMALGDIIDMAKDDPDLIPLSALGIFGFGVQTYKGKKSTKSNRFNF